MKFKRDNSSIAMGLKIFAKLIGPALLLPIPLKVERKHISFIRTIGKGAGIVGGG